MLSEGYSDLFDPATYGPARFSAGRPAGRETSFEHASPLFGPSVGRSTAPRWRESGYIVRARTNAGAWVPAHSAHPDSAARRRGVAADEVRHHNLSLVLQRLHLAGPMTRSQLASATGLSRVHDRWPRRRTGLAGPGRRGTGLDPVGRPGAPHPWSAAGPRGRWCWPWNAPSTRWPSPPVGLGGHVFDRRRAAAAPAAPPAGEGGGRRRRLAEPLLVALPATHRLVGVGVAVAGIARRSDGLVHLAPNLGWRDVPLGELLAAQLGQRSVVGGQRSRPRRPAPSIAAACARVSRNLIYISGEVGIGAGVIIDGEPLLGAAGYAGEVGHTLVNPPGRRCGCGASGCWETEAGEAAPVAPCGRRGGAPRASPVWTP